jgi:hypothetical protein
MEHTRVSGGKTATRQAIGCRSFFLLPSILGNDSVLYHSLFGLASQQQILGALSEMPVLRPSEANTFVNTCRLQGHQSAIDECVSNLASFEKK